MKNRGLVFHYAILQYIPKMLQSTNIRIITAAKTQNLKVLIDAITKNIVSNLGWKIWKLEMHYIEMKFQYFTNYE